MESDGIPSSEHAGPPRREHQGGGAAPGRWALRTSGPGRMQGAADREGEDIRSRVTSSDGPPQGEQHAHHWARMVAGRLWQLGFPWETALGRADGRRYWPVEKQQRPTWVREREEFERLFDPGKADAVAYGRNAPLAPMQVTRVVIDDCFAKWRRAGEYDGTHSPASIAAAVWQAIEKKTARYRDDPARTMLVLAPSALLAVFDGRVLPVFFEQWGAREHLERWACVWLASSIPGECRRLDGRGADDGRAPILGIAPGPRRV